MRDFVSAPRGWAAGRAWPDIGRRRMMRHHEVLPISREDAELALGSGFADRICDALVRLAFHDPDWRTVQNRCLEFVRHEHTDVRGAAITCLGHLARIHGVLDRDRVVPVLSQVLDDPEVGGRAQDALDDLAMFLKQPS